jgi:hypothetical protein
VVDKKMRRRRGWADHPTTPSREKRLTLNVEAKELLSIYRCSARNQINNLVGCSLYL